MTYLDMAAYEMTDDTWELVRDLCDPPVRRGPRATVPRRQVVGAMRRFNAAVREAEGRDLQPSVVAIDVQTTRGRHAGLGFHERGGVGRAGRVLRTGDGRCQEPS